jgi:L-ascorbate 6-phosphate lactonase
MRHSENLIHDTFGGSDMDLNSMVKNTELRKNEIAIFWLGQAGFIMKNADGTVVVIDPYLTDCCERIYGFKRLTPKLISPDQLKPDLLFLSHHHEDHFDIDAVPIMAASSNTQIIGSKTVIEKCVDMGIEKRRLIALKEGDQTKYRNISIKARFADHGESVPDAIGATMDINGTRIYYAGDTAYRPEKLNEIADFKPHIAILPINGAYGNLNSIEAASVAGTLGVKVAIPCHFWTFKEHCSQYGDPLSFYNELSTHVPECKAIFMAQGEKYIYTV